MEKKRRPYMKVGDFVLKITGDRDVGKRGIIVKIYNDKANNKNYNPRIQT